MTGGPLPRDPGPHLKPPRHVPMPREKGIKAYEKAVQDAERIAGEAVDHLLTEYLRLLEIAGSAYAREAERAMKAYNKIEGPARKAYNRQTEIAQHTYDSIINPANAELDRIAASAKEMYDRAITPIEAAYAQAINDAQALTQGVSLGNTPSN